MFATPVAPVFALAASRSGTGPKRRRAAGSMSKGSARARVFDGTARGEPHYDGRKHWLFGGKHVGEIGKVIRGICPGLRAGCGTGRHAHAAEKLLNVAREWMHAVMPDLVWRFRIRIISAASPKCGLLNRTTQNNKFLVSFDSEVRKRSRRIMMRTSESGH